MKQARFPPLLSLGLCGLRSLPLVAAGLLVAARCVVSCSAATPSPTRRPALPFSPTHPPPLFVVKNQNKTNITSPVRTARPTFRHFPGRAEGDLGTAKDRHRRGGAEVQRKRTPRGAVSGVGEGNAQGVRTGENRADVVWRVAGGAGGGGGGGAVVAVVNSRSKRTTERDTTRRGVLIVSGRSAPRYSLYQGFFSSIFFVVRDSRDSKLIAPAVPLNPPRRARPRLRRRWSKSAPPPPRGAASGSV